MDNETVKFRFRPFGNRVREIAPDHRYYYVFDANTGAKLLGIVRKGPDGRWSADTLAAKSAPVRGFRTRQTAAESLQEAS